jgi:DNA-binding transcriptional LysR family regulator
MRRIGAPATWLGRRVFRRLRFIASGAHFPPNRIAPKHSSCPRIVATNNIPMLRQFAEASVGIALRDELMGARAVDSGALLRLFTDWNLTGVPISLLTPTRFLSAKTRLFIEMLTRDVSGVVGLSP